MNLGYAFEKTLKQFKLKAKTIAQAADVAPGLVSRFRGGKAINTDSLEKLMEALSPEAVAYLLSNVVSAKNLKEIIKDPVALQELVGHLDDEETATLLYALAGKIRKDIPQ